MHLHGYNNLQSAINVIRESSNLQFILLWCPSSFLSEEICNGINEFANKSFPSLEWTYSCRRMNAANSGSSISTARTVFTFASCDSSPTIHDELHLDMMQSSISPHINPENNHWSNCTHSFVQHDDPTFQPTIQDPSIFILAPSAPASHLASPIPSCFRVTDSNPILPSLIPL